MKDVYLINTLDKKFDSNNKDGTNHYLIKQKIN